MSQQAARSQIKTVSDNCEVLVQPLLSEVIPDDQEVSDLLEILFQT